MGSSFSVPVLQVIIRMWLKGVAVATVSERFMATIGKRSDSVRPRCPRTVSTECTTSFGTPVVPEVWVATMGS